jgi:hypothetical protein
MLRKLNDEKDFTNDIIYGMTNVLLIEAAQLFKDKEIVVNNVVKSY